MRINRKLLIFHPAVAPYRIDFFNYLYRMFEAKIVLHYKNLKSQVFDYDDIASHLEFEPVYLKKGMKFLGRTSYNGYGTNIGTFGPDIVITGEYSIGTFKAVLYRKLSGSKYKIYSICDDSVKIAASCAGFRKLAREILLKHLDGLILCNDDAAKWYKEKFPTVRSFVFPIITEENRYRAELELSIEKSNELISEYRLAGKKVFMFVGRISEEKNLVYLVKSFIRAHEKHNDISLIIVGDVSANAREKGTEYKELLKGIISDNKADHYICMAGRFEGAGLKAWYNAAQVLVLPSTYEPFGAVVNEALLAGCQVMVSKNAGSKYLVKHKVNGEILDIDNEYIDFEYMINKIGFCHPVQVLRENLMTESFAGKIDGLSKWLSD